MVGGERVAGAAPVIADVGERVGLAAEVQQSGGEPRVEERSEGLLLAWAGEEEMRDCQ